MYAQQSLTSPLNTTTLQLITWKYTGFFTGWCWLNTALSMALCFLMLLNYII